jgi:transcriptional regulator with XRE-family HTH domain
MTRKELAFKAGVDRSYLSLLENDRKSPTLDMLFRICDALNAKVSAIIIRVEKKRKYPLSAACSRNPSPSRYAFLSFYLDYVAGYRRSMR